MISFIKLKNHWFTLVELMIAITLIFMILHLTVWKYVYPYLEYPLVKTAIEENHKDAEVFKKLIDANHWCFKYITMVTDDSLYLSNAQIGQWLNTELTKNTKIYPYMLTKVDTILENKENMNEFITDCHTERFAKIIVDFNKAQNERFKFDNTFAIYEENPILIFNDGATCRLVYKYRNTWFKEVSTKLYDCFAEKEEAQKDWKFDDYEYEKEFKETNTWFINN